MGLWSSLGDAFSSGVSFVQNVASKVYDAAVTAASYAGKALIWVAEKGEAVIQTVKAAWPAVKKVLYGIKMVVVTVAKRIPHPLAKKIAVAIDIGITALLALEKSPILKALDKAFTEFLPIVREFGEKLLNWSEIEQAKARQREFEKAEAEMKSDESKKTLILAQLINRFIILKSQVVNTIKEDRVEDMEHYLQLQAASRILSHMESRFNEDLTLEQVTDDDMFILTIATEIVEGTISGEISRFEEIIQKRFGKSLMAVVFEEMMGLWEISLDADMKKLESLRTVYSKNEVLKSHYERTKAAGLQLDDKESEELESLIAELPSQDLELSRLTDDIDQRKTLIEASEGMLVAYENRMGDYVRADIIEDIEKRIPELAEIIVNCMQRGTKWSDLESDQKNLVRNFAHIFAQSCEDRVAVAVEVGA